MTIRSNWRQFWFKRIDTRRYAALRMVFGILSALYLVGLLPYSQDQFSTTGWLGGNPRSIAILNGGNWSMLFIDSNLNTALFAQIVILFGAATSVLMAAGWRSRLMAGLTWLVWVSLWNRNPLLMDGDDAVLKLMCGYLALSPCGNCWSADACRQHSPQYGVVWPLRLIQFQIALIYFVSGWVKFHSPEWLDGAIIQYVLIHPHYSRWNGWNILHKPFIDDILATLAWLIRWWELLFPVLLLNKHTRKFSLAAGIVFHIGLLTTMNLRWFAVIMLSLYLTFIPESWFARIETATLACFRLIRKRP